MLVLASLPLPVADVEADLHRAGDSLVAERRYLHHQGILVRNSREKEAVRTSQTRNAEALPSTQTAVSGYPQGLRR